MIKHTRTLALAAALLLVTGCGADSTDDEAPRSEENQNSSTETPAADEPSEADEPGGTVRGVVNVDDTAYEITELRNCEPLDDGTIERELELQGIGEREGERVQIDVYIQKIAGAASDDVSWSGPEGVFGGPQDANITLDAAGTSVRGVATLVDGMTQTETVEIDFDLEVPDETIACR